MRIRMLEPTGSWCILCGLHSLRRRHGWSLSRCGSSGSTSGHMGNDQISNSHFSISMMYHLHVLLAASRRGWLILCNSTSLGILLRNDLLLLRQLRINSLLLQYLQISLSLDHKLPMPGLRLCNVQMVITLVMIMPSPYTYRRQARSYLPVTDQGHQLRIHCRQLLHQLTCLLILQCLTGDTGSAWIHIFKARISCRPYLMFKHHCSVDVLPFGIILVQFVFSLSVQHSGALTQLGQQRLHGV